MLMKLVRGRNNMVKSELFVNELIYQLHNKNRLYRTAIFIW